MPIVRINNKGVHILEMNQGASQTVVMIHGMFTNLSVFYFKIAPELAKHYHVVMYDLRSHGMSEQQDRGYNLDVMAGDLIALLDVLNLSCVYLVGYSYGGLIALKAAMAYPDRVDKIVVLESPKPDEGDAPEILQKYGNEFIDQYLNNYEQSTLLKPGKRQIEKNKKLYDYLFNHTSIKEDLEKDDDLFDKISDNPIRNQTLLLYGSDSDCISAGYFLNECLPHSSLSVSEGDHNLPIQVPQWISSQIIKFLN